VSSLIRSKFQPPIHALHFLTLHRRTKEEAVYEGEYRMSKVITSLGYNLGTPLLSYAGRNIDWLDEKNHHCANNQWSSRGHMYFGIDYQPLEVVFHKLVWPIDGQNPDSVPKTNLKAYRRYSKWILTAVRSKYNEALRVADEFFSDEDMHY